MSQKSLRRRGGENERRRKGNGKEKVLVFLDFRKFQRKRKIVEAKERGGGRRKLGMDKFEGNTRRTVGVRFQKYFSKRMKMRDQSFKKIQRKLAREEYLE